MRSKEVDEAIDTLQNCIADYVIGDFCVGKYCPMENECKDKDCPFNTAIDKVVAYISDLEETNRLLLSNNAKKSEEINKLKCENHDMKEQLQFFIPRRRVRRVYKQLGKILKQDGIIDDLEEVENEK